MCRIYSMGKNRGDEIRWRKKKIRLYDRGGACWDSCRAKNLHTHLQGKQIMSLYSPQQPYVGVNLCSCAPG